MQLQFLLPVLTEVCQKQTKKTRTKKLLEILCDPIKMSHLLAGLILLCDLIVRHMHLSESTHWHTLSFKHRRNCPCHSVHLPPCSNLACCLLMSHPWALAHFLLTSQKLSPLYFPHVIKPSKLLWTEITTSQVSQDWVFFVSLMCSQSNLCWPSILVSNNTWKGVWWWAFYERLDFVEL